MNASPERPPIRIAESDAELIANLLAAGRAPQVQVSELLEEELDRAQVLADKDLPDDVARIGSAITFKDEARDGERTVRLVAPAQADIAAGRISIMTPVGAGLLGLSPGQQIDWPDRTGRARKLTVVRVSPPSEA